MMVRLWLMMVYADIHNDRTDIRRVKKYNSDWLAGIDIEIGFIHISANQSDAIN